MRAMAGVLPVAVLFCSAASTALAQNPLEFTTTPVSNVTADAIASLPNGTVGSINGSANTVSLIATPGLTVTTFTVPTQNSGLAGITGGSDGNFWFTESIAGQIGRITPDGTITEFPIPAAAAPPQRIFPGPGGTVWATSCPFPEPLFFGCDRFIVIPTLGPAEPKATLLPIRSSSSIPFGPSRCTLGADNNEWCLGNESSQHPFNSQFKIARIDWTGGYTAFMPPTGTQGSAIVQAPDGNVWYTWLSGETTGLGRITPFGTITEYPIMTGKRSSWMFGLAVGADGNLYSPDRQTGILYQFVLSTATDAGTATINSGPIFFDIPEDLVFGGGPGSAGCPASGAFIVRSGGSLFGGLLYVHTKAPTECTDLVADVEVDRYSRSFETSGTAICYHDLDSRNDAKGAVLTIRLPPGSLVSTEVLSGLLWAGGTCTANGSDIRCDAPIIKRGFAFEVDFFGSIEAGDIDVSCTSTTAETYPWDNQDGVTNVVALPDPIPKPPPVDLKGHLRYVF